MIDDSEYPCEPEYLANLASARELPLQTLNQLIEQAWLTISLCDAVIESKQSIKTEAHRAIRFIESVKAERSLVVPSKPIKHTRYKVVRGVPDEVILEALHRNGGNRTLTARELGISGSRLRARLLSLKKQGIEVMARVVHQAGG